MGIDSGLDGAITFILNKQIRIIDTPTLTIIGTGKKKKREHNIAEMSFTLIGIKKWYTTSEFYVALEKVHSMPGQGVRSMFSMGEGYGIWKGLIAMTGWEMTLVTPQRWKKAMMEGMGKEKDASRLRALQLFPKLSDQLSRKKDHGRADSLLIAKFLQSIS